MSLFSIERWWYSPRSDKKLSLLAFLLMCGASAVFFFVLLCWPLPHIASALPALYRSTSLTQWLTPPPTTIAGWNYGSPSPVQRAVEEIVDAIKNKPGNPTALLVDASGHDDKALCSPAGTMFDGVAVYPGCAALSFPIGSGGVPSPPDENEIKAFRNFATVIVEKFQQQSNSKKDSLYRSQEGNYTHSEKILADALLVPDYQRRLEIPWVYVATRMVESRSFQQMQSSIQLPKVRPLDLKPVPGRGIGPRSEASPA
jgi:hypothetical protein